MTYKFSIYNARCWEIRWTFVDSLEEANPAVRCLQFFDGKYADDAVEKCFWYEGDIEIEDEDGEVVYENDIDTDTDEEFEFDIPEGKLLVVYIARIKGCLEYQDLDIEGTGDLYEDIWGFEKYNVLGHYGYSGILLNEGEETIPLYTWTKGDVKGEDYFIYDSDMNLIKEGDPTSDENIPSLDEIN
jgi:hypothetical protein